MAEKRMIDFASDADQQLQSLNICLDDSFFHSFAAFYLVDFIQLDSPSAKPTEESYLVADSWPMYDAPGSVLVREHYTFCAPTRIRLIVCRSSIALVAAVFDKPNGEWSLCCN